MSPSKSIHTVDEIQIVETRGPWQSKSGGTLAVLLALPATQVTAFLDYENPEFQVVEKMSKQNIRGLRSYTVSDIPKGSIGAGEWHRARTEYITALTGSVRWSFIDLNGTEREILVDGQTSVIVPPGILHTYRGLEDLSRLQVLCNTLFIPDDPKTHDTYSRTQFDEARAQKQSK
jgi:oxalate decarboxylase/phosphoglucose isomerase-like protein (cupin superfamily)